MKTITDAMIFMWLGNHADIPSGYSRVTDLDGYFIKGWGTENPNTTGGTAGHTHTSPAHTHTINAHTHTFTTGFTSGGSRSEDCSGDPCNDFAHFGHSHINHTMSTTNGGSLSDAVTYASTTWEPPHQRIIFLKPSAANAFLPSNAILLSDKTSLRPNWSYETSMTGKFLKGAGAGANPSQAGTTTHEHAINHTHSTVSHYHTGTIQNTSSNDNRKAVSWTSANKHASHWAHSHAVTFSSVNLTSSAYTGNAGSADTGIEPAHKKIRAIKNTSGQSVGMPVGGILLSLSLTVAPTHWKMKTELQNVFIKITDTNAEILTSGGNNTHSHAASNSHGHTDTTGNHNHSMSIGGGPADGETGAGSEGAAGSGHGHDTGSVSSTTASWGNATTSGNATTWQPPYRVVSFLELEKDPMIARAPLEC